nr:carbonic anhydrase [Paracoccus versutus]
MVATGRLPHDEPPHVSLHHRFVHAGLRRRGHGGNRLRHADEGAPGRHDPRDVIAALQEGNARFAAGAVQHCDLNAMVRETSEGQYPVAAVVGCIDSRVPPELVFDQKVGDLFTARIAGNYVNTDIIGSLEFACKVSGSRAIVVLGAQRLRRGQGCHRQGRAGLSDACAAEDRTGHCGRCPGQSHLEGQGAGAAGGREECRTDRGQDPCGKPDPEGHGHAGEIVVVAAMHGTATGEIRFL